MHGNESLKLSLLVEQTRVSDQLYIKYKLQVYDLQRVAYEKKIQDDADIKALK